MFVIYEGVGVTGVVGVGGQAKGRVSAIRAQTVVVFSIRNRDAHNPQDRLRQPLAAA